MVWIKKDIDKELVRELSTRYGVDLITASILARRGTAEPEDLKFFLENDPRYLHNPFLFEEMEDAVERILQAKEEGEKVRIFGDRDVDGITSTVLLTKTLESTGIDVRWALPVGDEPYGLSIKAVDVCLDEDVTLLITVDCGISNIKEIAYAQERGIDTIVIDHHNPQEELPLAAAIINPKMTESGYPFRDLAGCGVVSKVIWALRFAATPFYNQTICLLNVRPGNEAFILEAVRLYNLVEQERITETVVPGMVGFERTRLGKFFENLEVIVYDAPMQKNMLKKVFGPNTDIHLSDLGPEIWKYYPNLREKSLLSIREQSKLVRYQSTEPSELEVLLNLFITFVFRKEKTLSEAYLNDLDLVALGTLADLMPLRDENRILVRQGMDILNSLRRPGLRELVSLQNMTGRRLSTMDVAWQITPAINAAGRLGVPEKAVEFFLTDDEKRRKELASTIVGLNEERKRLGETGWESIFPLAKRSFEEFEGKFVFASGKQIHRGITGIICTRLVNFFNVPALTIAFVGETCVGSIRTIKGFNVKDFIERFSDLFIDYGGHDYAAGFSMEASRYEEFCARLKDAVASMEGSAKEEDSLTIDAEIPPAYLNPDINEIVERFEPYGEENPPLVFLSRGVKIEELSIVGNGQQHLRMLIAAGNFKWPAVFWKAADRVGKDFSLGETVDIVFRLGRNYFQNKEILQLTLLDVKK